MAYFVARRLNRCHSSELASAIFQLWKNKRRADLAADEGQLDLRNTSVAA